MSEQQKPIPTKPGAELLLHAFTEMFRAIARPAVTIIFAGVIAQVVVQGIPAPAWFVALAIPTITWWFTERTVMHIQKRKKEDT